jgi:hypothetical protein
MNGLHHLVKGFNLGFESFIDVPTKSLRNDYFSFLALTTVEPVLTIVIIHGLAHNLSLGITSS